MPIFELQTPDGRTFEVDAPNMNAAAAAIGDVGPAQTSPGNDESFFGRINNLARAGARGVPLIGGLTDEISAGLNTGGGLWGDYQKALAGERQQDQEFDAAHPTASLLAHGGGAVAGGLAMLPAKLFEGAGILGTMVKSALTGSGLGATESIIRHNGDDLASPQEVAGGATLGGVFGAVGPLVGKAVGAAWNGVGSWLANRGVDAKAIGKILSELQTSGMSPQQAIARLDEIGPASMVADVNPGMQTMTAATGMANTGARNTIDTRLFARRMGSKERTDTAREAAFGQSIDPFDMRLFMKNAGESLAYDDVLAGAPRLPDNLDDLLAQKLTFPGANMSLGNRKVMGSIFDQVDDALLADTPEMVARRLLDIRKSLDAQIVYDPKAFSMLSSADKATQLPLKEARKVIDDVLKENIHGIRELDMRYADAANLKASYDTGRRALRDGPETMTPNELAAMQGESTAEQNAMRNTGMSTEIDRVVGDARNSGTPMDRILRRGFNKDKVGVAVGKPKAEALDQALDAEDTMLGTSRAAETGYGSRTAPINAAYQRLYGPPDVADAITNAAVAGGSTGAVAPSVALPAGIAAGTASLMRGLLNKVFSPDPRVVQATADRLTKSGGEQYDVMQELLRRVAANDTRGQASQALDDQILNLFRLLTPAAAQAPSN